MRRTYKVYFSVAAFIVPVLSFCQSLVPFNEVFLQDEVASVHIQIHPDSLAAILHPDSLENDHEFPATFVYSSSNVQDTLENIGFRLRGNTSRLAEKKSFKVSFNTFDPNASYYGLEKMNLNGSHNDPSNLRVKLCWDALRHAGLKGSRTSHVNLYINGEFKGVYTHVEHIDEEFSDKHFQHGDGNLWKCLYPANLQYLGSDPDAYKLEFFGRRVYELKTNEEEDDYSALAQFIGMINNAPTDVLECELEDHFNIDEYLKFLAMDIILGNWDGYSFNQNNYYLYEDPLDGQIHYLMYDLDNTLGIDFFGVDWTSRDPYSWSPGEGERPLYDVVMAVPAFREAFSQHLSEFYNLFYIQGWMEDRALEIQTLIDAYMAIDEYYPLDYGFSYEDFQNSLDESFPNHVNFGVNEYLQDRFNSLNAQIENFTASPLITAYSDNSPIINENVELNVYIQGEVNTVELNYNFDGGSQSSLEFTDQGNGWWSASLVPEDGADRLNYNIIAQNNNTSQAYRCEEQFIWLSNAETGLYLNEIAANNSSIISDENGAYADYIELFLDFGEVINLGSVFLTDDPDEPWKWDIPAITLEDGEYQLIWADNDEEEGPFHAPFNLNATGDEVALFRMESGKWRLIDHHAFGAMLDDLTDSRLCGDQINIWQSDYEPTPNASNCETEVEEFLNAELRAYPNPSSGLFHFSQPLSGKIFDAKGRLINTINSERSIDLTGMENGLYIVLCTDGKQFKLFKI